MFLRNQPPCPVLGDSLPEPIVEQLRCLLRAEPTENAKPSKARQPQRPSLSASKAMLVLDRHLATLKQKEREELVFLDLHNDPMNLPWPESWGRKARIRYTTHR